ncbi:hypothetical protein V5P93_005517 [Actinokineospora auranticolor]|uniref:Uncharacterized protein n=1 Tax=Actinokineospora auranticolor TaxID=155976 RepID=A0A2S6GQB1_9PSEU|nr:hypothetical protein [Actinokineospora auranticolor]PPK67452.1 hypothetical protein CLV40_107116 [Actinokineospora auranticolor]
MDCLRAFMKAWSRSQDGARSLTTVIVSRSSGVDVVTLSVAAVVLSRKAVTRAGSAVAVDVAARRVRHDGGVPAENGSDRAGLEVDGATAHQAVVRRRRGLGPTGFDRRG